MGVRVIILKKRAVEGKRIGYYQKMGVRVIILKKGAVEGKRIGYYQVLLL